MFVYNCHGTDFELVVNNEGVLSVTDFSGITYTSAMSLNKALTRINTTMNGDVIRSFYTGLANGFMDGIKLDILKTVDGVTVNNLSAIFKLAATNMGYKLNEITLSEFNVSLFTDEVMKIYDVRIQPLIRGNAPYKPTSDTHHYITKVLVSYSIDELTTLDNHQDHFITGMKVFKNL